MRFKLELDITRQTDIVDILRALADVVDGQAITPPVARLIKSATGLPIGQWEIRPGNYDPRANRDSAVLDLLKMGRAAAEQAAAAKTPEIRIPMQARADAFYESAERVHDGRYIDLNVLLTRPSNT